MAFGLGEAGQAVAGLGILATIYFTWDTRREARAVKRSQEDQKAALENQALRQDAAKVAIDLAVAAGIAMGLTLEEAVALAKQTSEDLQIMGARVDGQMDAFRKALKDGMEQKARADMAEAKILTDTTASDLAKQVALDSQAVRDEQTIRDAQAAPVPVPIEATTIEVPAQTLNVEMKGPDDKSG